MYLCFIFAVTNHSAFPVLMVYVIGIYLQTYQHASSVIQSLVEEDINVKFLVQLDKLINLMETPTFAYLRLQVLLIHPSFKVLNEIAYLYYLC